MATMVTGMEARARLEAETKLLAKHRVRYRRLLDRKGHVEAVLAIVKGHKPEYDRLVKEAVERIRAQALRMRPAA